MKLLSLILLLSWAAFAQPPVRARFTTFKETTGTAEKLTVQQPATNARRTVLEYVWLSCANACSVTFFVNGTGATTTANTINGIGFAEEETPRATAFHTSNVGTGTQISPTYNIAAGDDGKTFGLSVVLNGNGITKNFTSSITMGVSGSIKVYLQWREE